MRRRHLLLAAPGATAWAAAPRVARAQAPEKARVTIAVGGRNLLYYLPLTIAEQKGFFKAEGLAVAITDVAGGTRALQAVVGGSADVVSGAFEHTVHMLHQGQHMRAFALQGRAPQLVLGVSPKALPGYRSAADLKGRKIGVTVRGSSTHGMVSLLLTQAGLKPDEVSIVGVGAANGAVAAMRAGQIDALCNLDPVITLLQRSGHLRIVTDTRRPAEAERVFGGPMPAGCLYAPLSFIERHPQTVQALATALVRANRWIQAATPAEVVAAVPESYLMGDRAVYTEAFLAAREALSADGLIPERGAETAFRALASVDPDLARARLDLSALYTNDFVRRANARQPRS